MNEIKRIELTGRRGYGIPALHNISGDERLVVVVSHGFASDKGSSTGLMLMERLAERGAAAIAYDFPAHGDSPADGHHLRVEECLDELADVEQAAAMLAPQARIAYFGSSFGGYITLLYLAKREHRGGSALLRCAAVNMPELFIGQDMSGEAGEQLHREGEYLLDYGFGRPLLIVEDFCADLAANDCFRLCRSDMARMAFIHGSADEEVPLSAVQRFTAQFGLPLTVVEGADHRFSNPGGMESVMKRALEFFAPELGE